jgi:hypothetical protein
MTRLVRSFAKRKAFLDALELGESETKAAMRAGGNIGQFRAWKNSDPDFAADWNDALEAGTDYLEDVATERAVEKSDALMLHMLKVRRPDKHDRANKLELSGGINVEGSKTKLLNKLARIQAEKLAQAGGKTEDAGVQEETEVKLLPAPGQPFAEQRPVDRGSKRRRKAESLGRASA